MKNKKIYVLIVILFLGVTSSIVLNSETFDKKNKDSTQTNYKQDKEQIRKQLEHYSKVQPENLDNLLSLGLLNYQDNKVDKAIENYNKVVELDPNNYLALYRLGNIELERNDFNKALNFYKNCVETNPKQVAPYIKISSIVLLEDYDKAQYYAQKAYELSSEQKADNQEYIKKYYEYVQVISKGTNENEKYGAFISILKDYIYENTLKLELSKRGIKRFNNIEVKEKKINSVIS